MKLATYLTQAVKRFPEAIALVDDQVRWTYRDLYEECTAVAANMQQLGLFAADHVLAVLKNRRETIVVYWASQLLGLIYTPLNFRMPSGDIAYCVNDASPRVIFYEEENRATIEEALRQAQHAVKTISVGTSSGDDTFSALRRRGESLQAVPGG